MTLKQQLLNLVTETIKTVNKKSPELLIGFGIAGFAAAMVLTVNATKKAENAIEEKEEETGEELQPIEKIKTKAKYYILPILIFIMSVTCIFQSYKIEAKRRVILAAAYEFTANQLSDYKDSIKEVLGPKKELAIEDKVTEKRLEEKPLGLSSIEDTGDGKTLFQDSITGRYFLSDMDAIKKHLNDFNADLIADTSLSVNDWLYCINLEPIETETIGEGMGWIYGAGGRSELLDIHFMPHLAKDSNTPCICIAYSIPPRFLAHVWGTT